MDGILDDTAHPVIEPAPLYTAKHSYRGPLLAAPPQLPVTTVAGAGAVFGPLSRRPEAQFQLWGAAAAGLVGQGAAVELPADATVFIRRQAVGRVSHHLVKRRRWSPGGWLFRNGLLGALADLFALLVLLIILAALVAPLL